MISKRPANVPANVDCVADVLFHPTPSRPLPLGTPPTPARRGRVLGVNEEGRLLVREARAVWEKFARKCGNPYVDSGALLLVGRMAIEATRWEDGLVILKAIREHMDLKSSPRRIPEWARLTGSAKREQEHIERKREAENAPIDPQVQAALSQAWRGMRSSRPADTRDIECECRQIFKADDRRSACLACGKVLHPICAKRHKCEVAA